MERAEVGSNMEDLKVRRRSPSKLEVEVVGEERRRKRRRRRWWFVGGGGKVVAIGKMYVFSLVFLHPLKDCIGIGVEIFIGRL